LVLKPWTSQGSLANRGTWRILRLLDLCSVQFWLIGGRDRQERLSYLAELTPRLECFRGSHNLLSINRRGTRISIDCETQYHCRTRFAWRLTEKRQPFEAQDKQAAALQVEAGIDRGMEWILPRWSAFKGDRAAWEVFLRRIYTTRSASTARG